MFEARDPSSEIVCETNIAFYLLSFVETPRKFIIAELSIRKLGSSSVLIIPSIISTDDDPSLWIESSAIINLRGVSTKLNKYIISTDEISTDLVLLALMKIRAYGSKALQ